MKEAVFCEHKFLEFKDLVDQYTENSSATATAVKDFHVYKTTQPQKAACQLYDAGIIIMASGQKRCRLNGQVYEYGAGSYFGLFLPVPIDVEATKASAEEPIMLVALKIDLDKIAEMLLKLDRLEQPTQKAPESAGITAPLSDSLLDPVIRLLKMLERPMDVAMLGNSIVDEIYYRVLTGEHVSAIRNLLEGRGQIQQISRAVEYINAHLAEPILIDDLAAKANMSVSHFHKNFKDVMQMSPLQYAKSLKLFKAQSLIQAGQKANQAAYAVGYNSTAQFSREYKRQFGVTPSATV